MNHIPITTVARRELEETGTDWRLLVPLMVLTFVVPLIILIVVLFLVQVTDASQSPDPLVPLALLLCGFLPAGFSLVSASESFVGEKERSTLESLLATPMTDRELYFGKLLAALVAPLCTSSLAMLTFTSIFLLQAPPEAARQLTTGLIALIAITVACKALVMVAGALVISIHATTVRAANLLASFLLVPMALVVQIEAFLLAADRPEFLLYIPLVLSLIATLLIRTGMSTFNRESILARDHRGFNLRRTLWTFKQFLREFHPVGVRPEQYRGPFSLMRFYRQDVPLLMRAYRPALFVAGTLAIIGVALGGVAAHFGESGLLPGVMFTTPEPIAPGVTSTTTLLATSLRLSFVSNILAGVTFGIAALVSLVVTGVQFGFSALWHALYADSSWSTFALDALPQLFKLPAIVIAGAFGLRMGVAPLHTPRGFSVGQNMLWALANFLKVFVLVLIPWFLLAALFEGWLLPLFIATILG